MSFSDQTAVVTGGTRGLGRAITLDLLEQGASVWATYHSNEEAARAFADECARYEGRLRLARFDVADYAAVEHFWEELEEQCPDGVQVLVSNSGIRRDAVMAMMPADDWARVLDTNLTGTFNMCKLGVLSMLRRRYGRIVIVTSPAREVGFAGQANYAASKAGQVGMMRSLSREVAKRGITVNCVSPGFVDTELLADLSDAQRKAHLATVPVGRFARPEEVAWAVRCLADRNATYITGTTLEVAGGL